MASKEIRSPKNNGWNLEANPDHDFPQRIIYRLDGDILNARIEGLINGKPQSMEWKWTDAKSAETNPRPTDK